MDLLDRTDVSNKNPGDSLTSADIILLMLQLVI